MASRFIEQKHAGNGESRDFDPEATGPRSAGSVPAATELFRPLWQLFALLIENRQSQFDDLLITLIYQSAGITLVSILAVAGLMPLQNLVSRRSAATTNFLASRMLVLALC